MGSSQEFGLITSVIPKALAVATINKTTNSKLGDFDRFKLELRVDCRSGYGTFFTLLRIVVYTNYSRCTPEFGTLCNLVVCES